MTNTFINKEQALQKAKNYCAYQERCHREVKEKLFGFGLHTSEVDDCIGHLIEENFLNEQRFAIAFSGGRFRTKQWGKIKIKYELKQKQISTYCINKALKAIDEVEYENTLNKLFAQKASTLKSEKNSFIKKKKIQDYLLQKGYEADLIRELLKKC